MKKKYGAMAYRDIPAHEKRITIATLFTLSRIVLTPIIIRAMVMRFWGVACILFVVAGLTDMVDGLLARYLNQKTLLGAFLDPIADKFLMVSSFFTLAFIKMPLFQIPTWFVLFVLAKETLQIIGGLWLHVYCGYRYVESSFLGKLTMAAQILFIICLSACYYFTFYSIYLAYFMDIIFLLMSASCIHYLVLGWRIAHQE